MTMNRFLNLYKKTSHECTYYISLPCNWHYNPKMIHNNPGSIAPASRISIISYNSIRLRNHCISSNHLVNRSHPYSFLQARA